MEIQILTLLSPIYYTEAKKDPADNDPADNNPADCHPFNYREGDGEKLHCFLLDENECSSFEPVKEKLLGRVVFSADALTGAPVGAEKAEGNLKTLPDGNYLFAQKREVLSREEIIDMAVEIQAEGLWRRLKPGRTLYLRYLFEDSKTVTQLYRPCS
jgi:hypothetical protein